MQKKKSDGRPSRKAFSFFLLLNEVSRNWSRYYSISEDFMQLKFWRSSTRTARAHCLYCSFTLRAHQISARGPIFFVHVIVFSFKFLWGRKSKNLRIRKHMGQQKWREIRKPDFILERFKRIALVFCRQHKVTGNAVLWSLFHLFQHTTKFCLLILPGPILGPRGRCVKKIRRGPCSHGALCPGMK